MKDYDWIILFVAIGLLVFILSRKFILWYLKIDRRVELMEEQNAILREIADQKKKG